MKVVLAFALTVMSFSSAKSEVRVVRDGEGVEGDGDVTRIVGADRVTASRQPL